eukprot:3237561-Rhodomonas_salina.3
MPKLAGASDNNSTAAGITNPLLDGKRRGTVVLDVLPNVVTYKYSTSFCYHHLRRKKRFKSRDHHVRVNLNSEPNLNQWHWPAAAGGGGPSSAFRVRETLPGASSWTLWWTTAPTESSSPTTWPRVWD